MVKKKDSANKNKKEGLKIVRKPKPISNSKRKTTKKIKSKTPTLQLKTEHDIAMDFATKAYKQFNMLVKSIVLFGSVVKKSSVVGSDIDIIMIIDDASIVWDQELIAWYREELDRILRANPYKRSLHINTIKLSTWWEDLIRGDPIVINILRNSEPLVDFAGFFEPLKFLLVKGKIKPSPEAIYNCLQRAPAHIQRSKAAELGSIEGVYWSMVDSAHAALIAAGKTPPSPEHIVEELYETFVNAKELDKKYAEWYEELLKLHKGIMHGKIHDLKGVEIDLWQERAEKFLSVMANLVKKIIS